VAKACQGAWWTKKTVAEEAPCKEKGEEEGRGTLDQDV